jgi:hypothetical protein
MMDDVCPYLRDEWDDRKGMTPLIIFGKKRQCAWWMTSAMYFRDEWDDRKGMTPFIIFRKKRKCAWWMTFAMYFRDEWDYDGWHLLCILGMNETIMDDICYVF